MNAFLSREAVLHFVLPLFDDSPSEIGSAIGSFGGGLILICFGVEKQKQFFLCSNEKKKKKTFQRIKKLFKKLKF